MIKSEDYKFGFFKCHQTEEKGVILLDLFDFIN